MIFSLFQGKHEWGFSEDNKNTRTCPICLCMTTVAQLCMGAEPGTYNFQNLKINSKSKSFQPFMLTVMLQPTVLFLAVTWRLTKQSNIGRKCRFPAEHPDFNPLAHSVLSPLSDHPDTSNSFFKPCRISLFFSFFLCWAFILLCTFIVML